jgi:ribose transport system permease protein
MSPSSLGGLLRHARLDRFALVYLFVGVIVFFSVLPQTPQFATLINLQGILGTQAVLLVLATATVVPLVAGQIDLSVGPTAGLASILCAGMMSNSGLPLGVAILVSVGTGVAVGLVNGLLVAKAGVNSIITTLGTSSVIAALVLAYSGGVSIVTGISTDLLALGYGNWLDIPKPFFFAVAVAVVAWYVLEQTPVGKKMYAAGSSPKAAELVGLNVHRLIIGSFTASGAIAGLCGVLFLVVQGTGNPSSGPNYTLPVIAAAFLGATALSPGRYNVAGTIVAIFFLAFSINGITLAGAAPWVSDFFNGVALVAAVGIGEYSGRLRLRRAIRDRRRADASTSDAAVFTAEETDDHQAQPKKEDK